MKYCDTCQLPRTVCDKSPNHCQGKYDRTMWAIEERKYERAMMDWELGNDL